MIIKKRIHNNLTPTNDILSLKISIPEINEEFFEVPNFLKEENELIEFLEHYRKDNFDYVNNYI